MTQRFLIIAWPADHEEDLEQAACDLQDVIDAAQMGGAQVIAPISTRLHYEIEDDLGEGALP